MDWVAAVFALLALLAGTWGSWQMRKAQQATERARRAEVQVDVYEGIEQLKQSIKTDQDAAEAVNEAWKSPP